MQQVLFQSQYYVKAASWGAFGDPCLHISTISKQTILTHEIDIPYDGTFIHTQNVCQIINTTFCFCTLHLICGPCADERANYTNGFFAWFFIEQRRFCKSVAGFVHVFHGNASGKYVRWVGSPMNKPGIFKCGYGCTNAGFQIKCLFAPTSLTGYIQSRTTHFLTLGG